MHGLPREFICHLKPLELRKKYKTSLKRKLEDYYSCDVIYALLFFLSFHSFCLKSASKRRGMTVMRRHSRFIHARSSIYRLFSSTILLKGHPPQVALLYSVDLAQTPYAGGANDRWAGSLRVVHFALFSHGHSPARFNYNTRQPRPRSISTTNHQFMLFCRGRLLITEKKKRCFRFEIFLFHSAASGRGPCASTTKKNERPRHRAPKGLARGASD